MKKTHKKILGFAGLTLVAAMTVFAVFMPNPGAVAASTVTDTIIVRVLSPTISIDITEPTNGQSLVYPDQVIKYDYKDAKNITVKIKYTDADGAITNTTLEFTPNEQTGTGSLPINLYDDYGYGDFVLEITATNADGVSATDAISFSLTPIKGEAEQEGDTGYVDVDLEYDENNADIDYIEINVYDKDGNIISALSPTRVPRPTKTVKLPFGENNIPDGEYIIEITAIGTNGEPIQPPYYTGVNYEEAAMPVPDTGGTPNTGTVFAGLNISKSDYLITGLIIFFLVGIFGIVFISKKSHDKKRR